VVSICTFSTHTRSARTAIERTLGFETVWVAPELLMDGRCPDELDPHRREAMAWIIGD